MRDQILSVINGVLLDVNQELDHEEFRRPSEQTLIYDGENGIDSLSLVLLLGTLEARINQEFGANILIASEKAMSMRNSPFRSVGSLASFVESELALA
jgi:acyl carrier protein